MNMKIDRTKTIRFTAAALTLAASISWMPSALAAEPAAFSDVTPGRADYEDICWAAEHGIAAGNNGKFAPDQKITVLQYYTMLSRSIPESEQDTRDYGAEKGSMLYHLRRVANNSWTGDYRPEIEEYKDSYITAGRAWYDALTANGVQIYSGWLYGQKSSNTEDGMRAAKDLGLAGKNEKANDLITRAQAAAIIHAAQQNTKTLAEPPIVKEMQGSVPELQMARPYVNEFYEYMMLVPAPIREAFRKDGWTISFDTDAISAYSNETGTYSISGMTVYSKKTIYLADAKSLLHEMGHYYQRKLETSGMDPDVYATFDAIFAQEKWSGSLYNDRPNNSGAEFFADAFAYYALTGFVRWGADAKLESQQYFDDLADRGWIDTVSK